MLTTTIPAYPYKEYADDDDIQAFFAAYNAATQNIVTWLATVNLPYYPGLSGALLEWVASGLYGIEKTSLAQTRTPASGLLNTELLNTDTLNSFTAPQTTYYDITDDVFKRILTWNFYKGDGKRFCMKWLKRRIMRFLVGTNGLDPNPLDPSFVIGPENTQAVSVTVVNDVLTVTINGAYISSLVQLQPNILKIFQAAFLGGVLDLPEQYTYAVNIVTSLTATASPGFESAIGIATTLTTGTASVSALGGNGAYLFDWTWLSGGAGITINSPLASATSFTASGMARGSKLTGVALCTVTDSAGHQATAVVAVTITNVSAVSVSLSTTSLSVLGASSTESTGNVTATISGGAGPYSILYDWQSGGVNISINEPTAATTNCTGSGLTYGANESGTLLCTVKDFYGQQASETCAVSISRASQLTVSASPASLSAQSGSTPITTGAVVFTTAGGLAPYSFDSTFAWTSNSDGASASVNSPASSSTTVTASGMSAGNTDSGTLDCLVTDALGQQAQVFVDTSFTYLPPLTRVYTSGSFTETVPNGYTNVVIELWGGGGGGARGSGTALNSPTGGAGGGAAGYCRSQYACSGGQTLQVSLGAAGAGGSASPGASGSPGTGSVVSSGTLSITTMTADGGNPGTNDGSGYGSGGGASGGNQTNVAGGNGGVGGLETYGTGGLAQPGIYGNTSQSSSMYGAGGQGGPLESVNGYPGQGALIVLRYT